MSRRKISRLIGIEAALLLIAVLASVPAAAQVYPVGLEGSMIDHITAEQGDSEGGWFPGTANLLFASIPGYGVYQGYAWDNGGKWRFVGPANDPPVPITALGVQHWGYGPRDGIHLYAGLAPLFGTSPDSPVLLRREFYPFGPSPEEWVRADSGALRQWGGKPVTSMAAFYFSGHTPPQPIVAWTDSTAVRSGPGGWFWEQLAAPVSTVLDMDVTPYWFGSDIWAAGAVYSGEITRQYRAAVFRSKDKGEHWEISYQGDEKEFFARAVAVSPGHPDTAWASIDGEVQRTTDGGVSWQHVLHPDTGMVIALACDPMNPSHVYAAADRDFSLYRSTDLGTTWRRIAPGSGREPRPITCMTVALMDTLPMSRLPRFGLFMGTRGTGVWVYDMLFGPTTDVASTPLPVRSQLTLYPNPARGAVNVTLRLEKTAGIDVEIFDLLGRRVLHRSYGEKTPGTHLLTLETGALAPGIYLMHVPGMGGNGRAVLQLR